MGSDPRQLLDPAMPLRESQPSEANSAEERQAASDSDEKIEFSADLNGLSRVLKPASQSLLDSVEEQRKRALIRRRLFGSRETEADADPVRIGRFVPLRRLGAGGMGVVYVAYDEQLRREVAVKLLHSTQEHGRSRLLSEARALARIAHPNIVTIYEVGESNQRVFIAMELVAGVTLREWLQRGPHSWREVVALFLQAGQGLWAVHQHGLVHREPKKSESPSRNGSFDASSEKVRNEVNSRT